MLSLYHTLKLILHVQVLTRCLQRRVGQVQTATPTLCATTWAGPFPACPQSSLPTLGLPAKSRSLSVASWTFRQDSLCHNCTSAPQYCLVCATPAFAHDQLDFECMGVSVCDTGDNACSRQSQPLVCVAHRALTAHQSATQLSLLHHCTSSQCMACRSQPGVPPLCGVLSACTQQHTFCLCNC